MLKYTIMPLPSTTTDTIKPNDTYEHFVILPSPAATTIQGIGNNFYIQQESIKQPRTHHEQMCLSINVFSTWLKRRNQAFPCERAVSIHTQWIFSIWKLCNNILGTVLGDLNDENCEKLFFAILTSHSLSPSTIYTIFDMFRPSDVSHSTAHTIEYEYILRASTSMTMQCVSTKSINCRVV